MRIQDHAEQQDRQNILKVHRGVDGEVPHADQTLVSIRKYLVVVLGLIRDELMKFAAFELHLLFVELIFILIVPASLIICTGHLLFPPLLIIYLVEVLSNALAHVSIGRNIFAIHILDLISLLRFRRTEIFAELTHFNILLIREIIIFHLLLYLILYIIRRLTALKLVNVDLFIHIVLLLLTDFHILKLSLILTLL